MLLAEEGTSTVPQRQTSAMSGVRLESRGATTNPQYIGNQHARPEGAYSPELDRSAYHNIVTRLNSRAPELTRCDAVDNPPAQSIQPSEATDPSYRPTHHFGGIQHPLKLVVGRDCSPTPTTNRMILSANNAVKAQRVYAVFDATKDEIGHAPRNVGEDHQSAADVHCRHFDALVTNDNEPWRTYLEDFSTLSSGQVRVGNGTGMSVPQPHIPARNTKHACTNWPQHNILGSLTHVNLSKVSASLPAHRQPGRPPSMARPSQRSGAVQEVNKDEAVWRKFVLDHDAESAIETCFSHETSKNSTSRATKGYASTRLPSAAVTSVSSTPFPSTPFGSLSGQASRISDNVQYAPRTASRSIPSAVPSSAVWGHVESLDGEDNPNGERGDQTSPGRFGEQSAHASLQNHASSDSEASSGTRMSFRGLN
ncbi:hypothetical protein E8E13_010212 [Curvularia kusanoi]|uniref:Uncharacterized protein n=1 Tax=Curvularia kusanoi TaxID=90978 RepID=A0A9P4WED7_CURKU|nr:hypothetical protein E8E13_010212 [Curvularia kusanoi]